MTVSLARTFLFEDQPITTLLYKGEPAWVVREIALALGYEEPRYLLEKIDKEWADEFSEGAEIVTLEGPDLVAYKNTMSTTTAQNRCSDFEVGAKTRHLKILLEPGLYAVFLKSEKPKGKEMRRWLQREVLPQLRKTGRYEVPGKGAGAGGRLADVIELVRASGRIEASAVDILTALAAEVDTHTVAGVLPPGSAELVTGLLSRLLSAGVIDPTVHAILTNGVNARIRRTSRHIHPPAGGGQILEPRLSPIKYQQYVEHVLHDERLRKSERAFVMAFADLEDQVVVNWLATSDLVKASGLSRSTIPEKRDRLRELGYIDWDGVAPRFYRLVLKLEAQMNGSSS